MSTHVPEPDDQYEDPGILDDRPHTPDTSALPEPPHPINWNLLSAQDLEAELLELSRWVEWLRHTYGLPAAVIPPYWHRHPELVWELSALHLHWLCAYDPDGHFFALDAAGQAKAWPTEDWDIALSAVPIVDGEDDLFAGLGTPAEADALATSGAAKMVVDDVVERKEA